MSNVFPFLFEDGQTTFHGTFLINKLKENYHANYDYFQLDFLKGSFFIKDKYQKNLYEENVKGLKAIIALKKEYIKEVLDVYEKDICFTNQQQARGNPYELMVVNTDMEQKLIKKGILNWLLSKPIKNLFIGNEKHLLAIK